MKIEVIDKDNIRVFLNSSYIDDISDKDSIIFIVKDFVERYKNRLRLRGFYKVYVYVNKKVGLFINMIKLEDLIISDVVDLKVIVYLDSKIYFKTLDYYVLPSKSSKYFDGKYFYCDVDDISNIYNVLEFGTYIYGDEVYDVLDKALIV